MLGREERAGSWLDSLKRSPFSIGEDIAVRAYPWCSSDMNSGTCSFALWFSIKLDLDIRGRNCDRTVEWSPALEGLDELGALLLGDSLEVKVQPHRIEQAHP